MATLNTINFNYLIYKNGFVGIAITPTKDLTQIINNFWIGFSILLLLFILAFIGFYLLNQNSQKKTNTILISTLKSNNETIVSRITTEIAKTNFTQQPNNTIKATTTKEREIPIKIVTHIKKHLEKFEKKQGFLDTDLKLTRLAEQFETNTKYLSKVILKEKGKTYRTYIKDLKVAAAKSRIDTEYKFRRYKMEVIAKECGFKTAESFSKHFIETYGVYPSKYIKKVETNFKKNW